jgi:hypothetical protein
MNSRAGILLVSLSLIAAAAPALAQSQPAQSPPSAPPAAKQDGTRDEAQEREAMKARLERWLADTKQRQERIEAALKSLNEGASTDAVRQQMEPRGDRPPGGSGRSRDGGPPRNGPPSRGEHQGPADSQAEREQVLNFIKANNPEMYERSPRLSRRIRRGASASSAGSCRRSAKP